MSIAFSIRPEAERDLTEARDWYEAHRDGLGKEFLLAVEDVFGRIRESPESYAVVYRGIRWARLRRFPYLSRPAEISMRQVSVVLPEISGGDHHDRT